MAELPKGAGCVIGCLTAIGVCVLLGFGTLLYFGYLQRGGVYDDLRTRGNQANLSTLVPMIERYKQQRGVYPDTLDALVTNDNLFAKVLIFDQTVTGVIPQQREFFYRRVGCDHYYLRSVGRDGVPFTNDDMIPDVESTSRPSTGLLVQRQPRDEAPCQRLATGR